MQVLFFEGIIIISSQDRKLQVPQRIDFYIGALSILLQKLFELYCLRACRNAIFMRTK